MRLSLYLVFARVPWISCISYVPSYIFFDLRDPFSYIVWILVSVYLVGLSCGRISIVLSFSSTKCNMHEPLYPCMEQRPGAEKLIERSAIASQTNIGPSRWSSIVWRSCVWSRDRMACLGPLTWPDMIAWYLMTYFAYSRARQRGPYMHDNIIRSRAVTLGRSGCGMCLVAGWLRRKTATRRTPPTRMQKEATLW